MERCDWKVYIIFPLSTKCQFFLTATEQGWSGTQKRRSLPRIGRHFRLKMCREKCRRRWEIRRRYRAWGSGSEKGRSLRWSIVDHVVDIFNIECCRFFFDFQVGNEVIHENVRLIHWFLFDNRQAICVRAVWQKCWIHAPLDGWGWRRTRTDRAARTLILESGPTECSISRKQLKQTTDIIKIENYQNYHIIYKIGFF